MTLPDIVDFTVTKKKAALFFFISILSVAITSLPLATVSYIGLKNSLSLMFFIEFMVGLIVYFCLFHKNTFFKIVTKTTVVAFFILLCLQLIAYTSKPHSVGTVHLSLENITSLITLVFFVPFYEEVFYRGCFLGFFSTIMGNWLTSIAATSLIFCIMHTQYTSVVDYFYLFLVSVVLCVVRVKNNNLLSPFLVHMSMNALVVVLNIQGYF